MDQVTQQRTIYNVLEDIRGLKQDSTGYHLALATLLDEFGMLVKINVEDEIRAELDARPRVLTSDAVAEMIREAMEAGKPPVPTVSRRRRILTRIGIGIGLGAIVVIGFGGYYGGQIMLRDHRQIGQLAYTMKHDVGDIHATRLGGEATIVEALVAHSGRINQLEVRTAPMDEYAEFYGDDSTIWAVQMAKEDWSARNDPDGDGIWNSGSLVDACPDVAGGFLDNNSGCPDADGDGIADHVDPDADGDKVNELDENGAVLDACPGTLGEGRGAVNPRGCTIDDLAWSGTLPAVDATKTEPYEIEVANAPQLDGTVATVVCKATVKGGTFSSLDGCKPKPPVEAAKTEGATN